MQPMYTLSPLPSHKTHLAKRFGQRFLQVVPVLPVLDESWTQSCCLDNPTMLDLIIIAVLAGFLGIFTFDFFTKKKTEVNRAHVVVGFHVVVNYM